MTDVPRRFSTAAATPPLIGIEREINGTGEALPRLRATLGQDLLPSAVVARCIEECGGPARVQDLNVPRREYTQALRNARYLRNRFTVLDLAAELGLT